MSSKATGRGRKMATREKPTTTVQPWVPKYGRALVPLDGSRLAESILPVVLTLASSLHLEVILLHVVPASGRPSRPLVPSQKKAMESIGTYLEEVALGLRQGGVTVGWRVTCDDPVEGIIRYASEGPVDFIAMSTHGTGGSAATPMGSVAAAVVERQTRPVLLLKPDETLAAM